MTDIDITAGRLERALDPWSATAIVGAGAGASVHTAPGQRFIGEDA
jgi:hypothetical protein